MDMTDAYLSGGEALIVRQYNKAKQVFSFLTPFTTELWMCIAATCIIQASLQFVVSRMSPYGAYRVRPEKRSRLTCGLFTWCSKWIRGKPYVIRSIDGKHSIGGSSLGVYISWAYY